MIERAAPSLTILHSIRGRSRLATIHRPQLSLAHPRNVLQCRPHQLKCGVEIFLQTAVGVDGSRIRLQEASRLSGYVKRAQHSCQPREGSQCHAIPSSKSPAAAWTTARSSHVAKSIKASHAEDIARIDALAQDTTGLGPAMDLSAIGECFYLVQLMCSKLIHLLSCALPIWTTTGAR